MNKFMSILGRVSAIIFQLLMLVMDLILKISKEEIGLITDVDRHLSLETLIRRGHVFNGDVSWEPTRLNKAPAKNRMPFFWI